jgi:hypothetical protein
VLVVVSDFCFDENITDKKNWLGGVKVNGENVTGFDGLSAQLSAHFSCLETTDFTQIISVNSTTSITKKLQVSLWQLND